MKKDKKYYSEIELKSLLKRAFDEEIKDWKDKYDFEVGYFESSSEAMFTLKFELNEAARFLVNEFRPDTKGIATEDNPFYPRLVFVGLEISEDLNLSNKSYAIFQVNFIGDFMGRSDPNLCKRRERLKEKVENLIDASFFGLRYYSASFSFRAIKLDDIYGSSGQSIRRTIKRNFIDEKLDEDFISSIWKNLSVNSTQHETDTFTVHKICNEDVEKDSIKYSMCSFLFNLIKNLPWWCSLRGKDFDVFSEEKIAEILSSLVKGGIIYLFLECVGTFSQKEFIMYKASEKIAVQNLSALIDKYGPKEEEF